MEDLARFSITMEADLLGRFDALVASRGTKTNRSEAVRDLVRDALVENAVEDPDAIIAGTITMVFDHHGSDLSDKLNTIQHQYIHEIVSTVHVHLDSRHCLEVIVLRGASAKIRAIANTLLGTKGVKHGKLVTTTTGDGKSASGAQTREHGQPHGHAHATGAPHPHSHGHA
jgi:CopG family nickel-responsive transcriptional regulator